MLKNYCRNRCYIVAEIGGNFNNFEQAKRLIDEACNSGADAIKIQTFKAKNTASKAAFFDMENTGNISQYELFKKYEVNEQLHIKLNNYVKTKSLDWFSTPSHQEDVDLLEKLDIPAYKIGSDDATNIPFLKYVAKKSKPIFLSTGMCTMQEVEEAVIAILEEGNKDIIILHAITAYPTHPEDVNLFAMKEISKKFPFLEIGYSDHTIGINACIFAAALGARVIEKHFTYDKNADGPDHIHSADPKEMKQLVNTIREMELMFGDGIKRPAKSEKTTRINNRKSLVIVKSIKKGEIIKLEHLSIKRPGTGIPPKFLNQIIGRKATKDLEIDDVLNWGDC